MPNLDERARGAYASVQMLLANGESIENLRAAVDHAEAEEVARLLRQRSISVLPVYELDTTMNRIGYGDRGPRA